jgi:heme-degrading monooxygenase HmoA
MYGSVSRWRVTEGKQEEFERLSRELMQERPPGSRSVMVYKSDADSTEYWVVGAFESRDAYANNSATPEQNDRFTRLRALMQSDPEWHDGEVVISV